MSNSQKSNQRRNKWLKFVTMPIQMGVTIYLFFLFGSWLDRVFMNSNQLLMKIITLLGVAISLYQFIKQANQLNKND